MSALSANPAFLGSNNYTTFPLYSDAASYSSLLQVDIGTPSQRLNLSLAFSQSYPVLPAPGCSLGYHQPDTASVPCLPSSSFTFDPTKSTSFVNLSDTTNTNVPVHRLGAEGTWATDNIKLSDAGGGNTFEVSALPLAEIYKSTPYGLGAPGISEPGSHSQGVFGLGYEDTWAGKMPFIGQGAGSSVNSSWTVGVDIPRDSNGTGALTWGGVSTEYRSKNSTYVPTWTYEQSNGESSVSVSGSWIVLIDGLSFNGVNIELTNPNKTSSNEGLNIPGKHWAFLEPAYDTIQVPNWVNEAIFGPKGLNLPHVVDRSNVTVPCDLAGNLTFKIGGSDFTMDHRDLVFRNATTGKCSSSLSTYGPWTKATVFSQFDGYTFGGPFFRSIYTALYVETSNNTVTKSVVGFAQKPIQAAPPASIGSSSGGGTSSASAKSKMAGGLLMSALLALWAGLV